MSSVATVIDEWQEQLKLVAYFVVITATAWLLFPVLGEGWRQSGLTRPLVIGLTAIVNVEFAAFVTACFGGFLGILTLITVDAKKRWQGALLWVGTFVALIALSTMGLFIPNLDLAQNVVWLLVGFVGGLVVGGGENLSSIAEQGVEFRRASSLFLYIASLLIVVGMIEHHVSYPQLLAVREGAIAIDPTQQLNVGVVTNSLLMNGVTAGLFLGTLNRFVKYDAEREFFVLGPPNSGKSLFLVGAYLSALEEMRERHQGTSPQATSDLMDMVGELDTASDEEGWSIGSTGQSETRELEFQYVSGRVFPMNVKMSSFDYAGEFLRDLPDALAATPSDIDNPTLQRLTRKVQEADTLILLIDCEQFDDGENLNIEPYFDILQSIDDKDVKLVATKADVLGENFREQESLEPHNYFDEFVDYVNNQLTEYNQQVLTLVQTIGDARIHPVYYQTKVNEEGERVPMRDRKGNVLRNGYRQLLEVLG
jgi:hypothetical protein